MQLLAFFIVVISLISLAGFLIYLDANRPERQDTLIVKSDGFCLGCDPFEERPEPRTIYP